MSRNIVICADGTSNDVTGDSTNVLRLYRSLERSDRQLVMYDPGVGTIADPTKKTSIGKWYSRNFEMGLGLSVRENACNTYRFLCRNYQDGDRIFLFGFSRGAYTIRTLAGMIHFVGLVRPELEDLDRHAWSVYADDDGKLSRTRDRFKSPARFKKAFGIEKPAEIYFVGAWDTVSAFGFLWNLRTSPYTADNPSIRHIRHAVSIDERRALFQENLFRPVKAKPESFKEVWFAGTHGDVGGGWPEDCAGLAKITLKWMFREAEAEGLYVNSTSRDYFIGPSTSSRGEKLPGPDVMCRVNPSLGRKWWFLECIPRRQWDHTPEKSGMKWFGPHLDRCRKIPEGATLHHSVLDKVSRDKKYKPCKLPASYEIEY